MKKILTALTLMCMATSVNANVKLNGYLEYFCEDNDGTMTLGFDLDGRSGPYTADPFCLTDTHFIAVTYAYSDMWIMSGTSSVLVQSREWPKLKPGLLLVVSDQKDVDRAIKETITYETKIWLIDKNKKLYINNGIENTSQTQARKNKIKAINFLADNQRKDGIKTLISGLQYQVLKKGTGAIPKKTDTVVTHYRGTFIDGSVFDSSYNYNKPATVPVSKVIKGWTEALQKMKVGSKWKLFVPPELAYGSRGAGTTIEPNMALIFEIELLEIKNMR